MLKRSLVSFAIIVSGLFLANSAYGQSAAKGSMNRSTQTQTINSPRDVATGQLIDTSTGEIVWARSQSKLGNFEIQGLRQGSGATQNKLGNFEIQDIRSNGRGRGLIDTSTGEIVWADEVKKNGARSTQFTGSDEELAALIAWLRATRPTTSALDAGGAILGDDVRSSGSLKNRGRVRGLIDTITGEIVW